MRKLILFFVAAILLSGCYTVTQVGNCKYYKLKPQFRSSYYKTNKPIGF